MNESPTAPDLKGRHVGITHSGDGARHLIRAFQRLNATVHHIPLVTFAPVDDQGRWRGLQDVQWLVLTSPQGVKAVQDALAGRTVPDTLKWAAVGESTARALRQGGLPVHFLPSRATGAALGQELPFRPEDRVLHVTSDQARNDLADALRARGGQYERLVLYHTVARTPPPGETALLLASHAVTLASSSAAQQFAHLGGQRTPVVVMGRQTAQTAHQLGFQHVTVARQPSLPALQEAVTALLSQAEN